MERKTSVTNMLPICKLWCLSIFLLYPKNLLSFQFCFHSHGNFNRKTGQRHKLGCISTYSDQEICNALQYSEQATWTRLSKCTKNFTVKIVIMVITKGDYLCLGRIKVDHYNVLTLFNKQKAYFLNHEKKINQIFLQAVCRHQIRKKQLKMQIPWIRITSQTIQ